jgi:hypothetical protein
MAAVFDAADPVHLSFVTHAAALYAFNFGVPLPAGYDSPALLAPLLASIAVPDFVPKAVKIKANETDNTVEGADDDNDAIAALTAKLSGVASSGSLAGLAVSPADFEKVRACVHGGARAAPCGAVRGSCHGALASHCRPPPRHFPRPPPPRRMTTQTTTSTSSPRRPTCARATTRSRRPRATRSR